MPRPAWHGIHPTRTAVFAYTLLPFDCHSYVTDTLYHTDHQVNHFSGDAPSQNVRGLFYSAETVLSIAH